MSWFGTDEGRSIAEVLTDVAMREPNAVLAVVGRGMSGTVWLSEGRIAFANTDLQPELRRALQLTGVADALSLAALARSAAEPASERPEVTPDVVSVVEALTDDAVAQLLELPQGSLQLRPTERPPFGVLSSRYVDDVLAAARGTRVRDRVAGLGTVGAWMLRPAAGDEVTLTAHEWDVVRAMARRVRADELALDTGRAYDQVRGVLGSLAERGLATRTAVDWSDVAPAAALPERPQTPVAPPVAPVAPLAAPARGVDGLTASGPSALDLALRSAAVRASGPAGPAAPGADGLDDGRVPRPGRAAALRRLIGAVRTG